MASKRTTTIIRILLFTATFISLYFVPWPIVSAWIKPLPNTIQEQVDKALEVIDKLQLIEWFANNYKSFGTTLEFVTDKSQEGTQFVKGFGGLGGILRYYVDFIEDDFD